MEQFTPKLGDPYRFCPSGLEGKEEVTGKIVRINMAHRFFNVVFQMHGFCLEESIKF